LIVRVLTSKEDEKVKQQVRQDVKELTTRFPVPGLDL
jgi:glycine/serine hydroxymethyltransferase